MRAHLPQRQNCRKEAAVITGSRVMTQAAGDEAQSKAQIWDVVNVVERWPHTRECVTATHLVSAGLRSARSQIDHP
jgi:hypothetical protein